MDTETISSYSGPPSSKSALLAYTLGGLLLAAIPITTVLIQSPNFLEQKASQKETGVTISKSVVEATLSRKDAVEGKAYGPGFSLASVTAEGWQLVSLEGAEGVGFSETIGKLNLGERIPIRAYVDISKPNGKYLGTYQVRYVIKDSWYDGPTVNYIIHLVD